MEMTNKLGNNIFTISYYEYFLSLALKQGYEFCTLNEYILKGYPNKKHFIIRHDIDLNPITLKKQLKIESKLGISSTNFVRIAGAKYNFLNYPILKMLLDAESNGHEIGLHTNYVEFSKILNLNKNKKVTKEDVQKAYLKIQKKIHPDISPETSRLSSIVNEAKEVVLKDLS